MKKLLRHSGGATAIEYALIAGLIALGAILGMQALGGSSTGSINATFNKASAKL